MSSRLWNWNIFFSFVLKGGSQFSFALPPPPALTHQRILWHHFLSLPHPPVNVLFNTFQHCTYVNKKIGFYMYYFRVQYSLKIGRTSIFWNVFISWTLNSPTRLLAELWYFFLRGIFWNFSFYIRYSTLLHLPPFRFTVSEDAGIEPVKLN
jgi:hypothetical protein